MIIFNELRISEDKRQLIVDCEVEDVDMYEGVYIKQIVLVPYEKMSSAGTFKEEDSHVIYYNEDDDDTVRAKRVCCSEEEVCHWFKDVTELDRQIFYVVTRCDAAASVFAQLETMGCGADNVVDTGVIIDWQTVYAQGMAYANAIANNRIGACDSLDGFEEFVMIWYALRLAVDTCNYTQVASLWKKFLRVTLKNGAYVASGCGCGR